METYKLLTVDEAKEATRLWKLYEKLVHTEIEHDTKSDEEFIALLVSIAVDTCSYCHDYDKSCQCWNDE